MKLLSALLAASIGLALAHDDHGGQHIPKILGPRKFLSALEARRKVMSRGHVDTGRQHMAVRPRGTLRQRQDDGDDAQCGPGVGSCASGYCCSAEGRVFTSSSAEVKS